LRILKVSSIVLLYSKLSSDLTFEKFHQSRNDKHCMHMRMCCSVLQCVAVCCSVCCSVFRQFKNKIHRMNMRMCCSVLRCVAVCVAVCCSVRCSVFHLSRNNNHRMNMRMRHCFCTLLDSNRDVINSRFVRASCMSAELLQRVLHCVLQGVLQSSIVASAESASLCFRVAACCSMLQRVAACCSMLQHIAACCSILQHIAACCRVLQCVQCVAM